MVDDKIKDNKSDLESELDAIKKENNIEQTNANEQDLKLSDDVLASSSSYHETENKNLSAFANEDDHKVNVEQAQQQEVDVLSQEQSILETQSKQVKKEEFAAQEELAIHEKTKIEEQAEPVIQAEEVVPDEPAVQAEVQMQGESAVQTQEIVQDESALQTEEAVQKEPVVQDEEIIYAWDTQKVQFVDEEQIYINLQVELNRLIERSKLLIEKNIGVESHQEAVNALETLVKQIYVEQNEKDEEKEEEAQLL